MRHAVTRSHPAPLACQLAALILLLLGLCAPARATTPPPATGRPLAEALNPDGTLKAGLNGSFDARQFRMGTAPDGRPVFRPAGTKGAGDERWADGFGLPNGTDETVVAVVRSGNDIYIGGVFTTVGSVLANSVARWNGTTWSSLGTGISGFDGGVYALAVAGNGDVYVGGSFSSAGGVAANNVARWNGTAWSSLGTGTANGVNDAVDALAVTSTGNLYVGGNFTQAGGAAANYVTRWNGTAWSTLGTGIAGGMNTYVAALAVAANGDVYAGGLFTQAGGVAANNVARWNGTAWSSLGAGVGNGLYGSNVNALAVAGNGDVYAGGGFTQAGGAAVSRVARWNGTAWSGLGAGVSNGTYDVVTALALAGNGDVYAGGYFTQAGGVAASNLARWNGTTWSPVGTGSGNGIDNLTLALALTSSGDLCVGGNFGFAGGVAANHVATWNGAAWSPLGIRSGTFNGVDGLISALAIAPNGDVYVGGYFTSVGGTVARNVARWNGTTWSSLGTGAANGVDNEVTTLAIAGNGHVYVGGFFLTAGGVAANRVARWNGTTWSALGTGFDDSSNIDALAVAPNGDVYVSGYFYTAGGTAAQNVARWNGSTWGSLGAGIDRGGFALAVAANGDLYVGGNFSMAGSVAARGIARWNGTAWSALGTGLFNGVITALAVATNGDVYAGGNFLSMGGTAANSVARWNGTAWSSLGTGIPGANTSVKALTVAANGDVYAGGYFAAAGGTAANNIARWDGTTWSSLGTGTNRYVAALGAGLNGKLYAGGAFAVTGDGSKFMAHFGIYDPNAPLATKAPAAAPAAQLFPNPAHGTATLRLPAGAPRLAVTLSDALGRVVRRYPAPAAAEAALDLRGLPAGGYVLRCGEVSQRLVVE